MGKLLRLLLVLAALLLPTTAFLAPKVHSSSAEVRKTVALSKIALSLSKSPDGNNSNKRNDAFPKSRTDIRMFLTQRSIQSFVYLLNQCREDHTVRWLEKTLDFSSIDNFHGTGAFNQTKFPEWDSVFLDCVDRPEEVVVLEVRQRRRQQKLSGHNTYFESLKQTSKETEKVDTTKKSTTSRTTPKRQGFSTGNYLESMSSSKTAPESSPASSTPKKEQQAPKITSRKLSGASNYLENITSPPAKKETKPTNKSKDNEEKKSKTVTSETKASKDKKEKNKKSETPNPIQRRAFASSNYLENLSSVSNATNTAEPTTAQSTESSKNPYLEEKTKEYELSIDPPALVRRILSVRELISKEWVEDLEMLLKLNDDIAESFDEYNSKVEPKAMNDDEEDHLKVDNVDQKIDDDDESHDKTDCDESDSDEASPPALSKESIEKKTRQAVPGDEKRQNVFDRSILSTWSQTLWSPKRSSSPFRKANFDLLLLLATQESIHRVLNSYKNDDSVRPQTHEWLLDFYADNVNEYFDGHQTYARSEDFLEEMSKSPRTLIETNSDMLAWTDPAIVAEDIVRERSEVILGWIKVAENILQEHTDLRRLLFTNMVSKSFPDEALSDTILTAVKKEATNSTNSPTEVFGAFE